MYSLYRIMFLQDSAFVHVLSVLDFVLTGLSICTCTLCTWLCFNRTQHLYMYSLYRIMFSVFTGLCICACTLCTGLCFNRTQHLYMYSLYWIMLTVNKIQIRIKIWTCYPLTSGCLGFHDLGRIDLKFVLVFSERW